MLLIKNFHTIIWDAVNFQGPNKITFILTRLSFVKYINLNEMQNFMEIPNKYIFP